MSSPQFPQAHSNFPWPTKGKQPPPILSSSSSSSEPNPPELLPFKSPFTQDQLILSSQGLDTADLVALLQQDSEELHSTDSSTELENLENNKTQLSSSSSASPFLAPLNTNSHQKRPRASSSAGAADSNNSSSSASALQKTDPRTEPNAHFQDRRSDDEEAILMWKRLRATLTNHQPQPTNPNSSHHLNSNSASDIIKPKSSSSSSASVAPQANPSTQPKWHIDMDYLRSVNFKVPQGTTIDKDGKLQIPGDSELRKVFAIHPLFKQLCEANPWFSTFLSSIQNDLPKQIAHIISSDPAITKSNVHHSNEYKKFLSRIGQQTSYTVLDHILESNIKTGQVILDDLELQQPASTASQQTPNNPVASSSSSTDAPNVKRGKHDNTEKEATQ